MASLLDELDALLAPAAPSTSGPPSPQRAFTPAEADTEIDWSKLAHPTTYRWHPCAACGKPTVGWLKFCYADASYRGLIFPKRPRQ